MTVRIRYIGKKLVKTDTALFTQRVWDKSNDYTVEVADHEAPAYIKFKDIWTDAPPNGKPVEPAPTASLAEAKGKGKTKKGEVAQAEPAKDDPMTTPGSPERIGIIKSVIQTLDMEDPRFVENGTAGVLKAEVLSAEIGFEVTQSELQTAIEELKQAGE